jgi:hypothetical protein
VIFLFEKRCVVFSGRKQCCTRPADRLHSRAVAPPGQLCVGRGLPSIACSYSTFCRCSSSRRRRRLLQTKLKPYFHGTVQYLTVPFRYSGQYVTACIYRPPILGILGAFSKTSPFGRNPGYQKIALFKGTDKSITAIFHLFTPSL